MHRLLPYFSCATAMLVYLTAPLQIGGIQLGISAESTQAQTAQGTKKKALQLLRTGVQQFNRGRFQEALQTFEQALGISRSIGDRRGEAATLSQIGGVYNNMGLYAQALKFHEQALAVVKEIGDKEWEGAAIRNIGTIYASLGQYAQALKFLEQALIIAKEVGDKKTEGATLYEIGAVYSKLGQYSQTFKFYEQALVIFKEMDNKLGAAATLSGVAGVYRNIKRYSEALKFQEQALVIVKKLGNKAAEGAALNNIGALYVALGQYPQGLKFLDQGLVIAREVGDKGTEANTLNEIAFVYSKQGEYPQALKLFEQALVIFKELGDKVGEATSLSNIGAVYKNINQYAEAEKYLFAAIEINESLRPGLTDENKVSIFEKQSSIYRGLQQVLVAQNKINTALEIAERSRGRAFVELLASRLSSETNNQLTIKPPTIEEIQLIAKEQNATLVQYSIVYDYLKGQGSEEWYQSELFIWVIKPTGEVAFKQVDLKSLKISLKDLVTSSRDQLSVRGRGLAAVVSRTEVNRYDRLHQLSKILIEPITEYLPKDPNERVVFIPQESLFLVPFPALKDSAGQYLIEKHTILTAPAIQVLQLTHEKRQKLSGTDVLVVGNPTMPQVGKPPEQLSSLPGAEREAQAIAQLMNTQAITGADATESTVVQKMKTARIIHLATHGLLDNLGGLSVAGAIALAPTNQDDGLLTAAEILDLNLSAELVVLSACDTGRGNITGDGVLGLSRSLISAGVPSVIVSLWAVPDAPTASLMTEFYKNFQLKPDKAQSLRQAMLTTMKQHPNPRDWAAFTLIGEAE